MALSESLQQSVRTLAAMHLRWVGALGDTPTDVLAIAEQLRIRVISEPCLVTPTFTGVSLPEEGGNAAVIVVNALLPEPRWRFTIGHEIGHLVLGHRPPRDGISERLANIYASELLMPTSRLVLQIRRWGTDARFLAERNGVSLAAMRLRLQEFGLTLV